MWSYRENTVYICCRENLGHGFIERNVYIENGDIPSAIGACENIYIVGVDVSVDLYRSKMQEYREHLRDLFFCRD